MFPRHPANNSLKLHQFVSFDVLSYVPFLCFKLYSLIFFSIAHAQTKIMFFRMGHNHVE